MKRLLALIALAPILSPGAAVAEFAHTNPQDARVTHAKLGRMVVENQAAEPNITIEYEEGMHAADGAWIKLGVNHRLFIDHPEEYAEDGVTVIQEARPEYTELLTLLKSAIGAVDQTEQVEAHLAEKIAEDRAGGG